MNHSTSEQEAVATWPFRQTPLKNELGSFGFFLRAPANRAGSYACVPAKAKHEARCAAAGPCVLFIAFESPIDAVLAEGVPL